MSNARSRVIIQHCLDPASYMPDSYGDDVWYTYDLHEIDADSWWKVEVGPFPTNAAAVSLYRSELCKDGTFARDGPFAGLQPCLDPAKLQRHDAFEAGLFKFKTYGNPCLWSMARHLRKYTGAEKRVPVERVQNSKTESSFGNSSE